MENCGQWSMSALSTRAATPLDPWPRAGVGPAHRNQVGNRDPVLHISSPSSFHGRLPPTRRWAAAPPAQVTSKAIKAQHPLCPLGGQTLKTGIFKTPAETGTILK